MWKHYIQSFVSKECVPLSDSQVVGEPAGLREVIVQRLDLQHYVDASPWFNNVSVKAAGVSVRDDVLA